MQNNLLILYWKEVEILTRVKKKGKGNHINLETARLKGCGNSMALLIEWLEATVWLASINCLAYCRLSTAKI